MPETHPASAILASSVPTRIVQPRRRQIILGSAAAIASGLLPGHAQGAEFANRPIRMIIPTAAGGGNDATGRIYAEKAGAILKRQIVVENVPGANGLIGARAARSAKPDGHTFLWSSSGFSVFAPLADLWPFDLLKEFRIVARLLAFDLLLVASPSLGVRTLKELITRLRTDRVPWGNSGMTTTPNVTATVFNDIVGGKGIGVPYSGSAPALNALLGGHVSFMFNTIENVKGHVDAGKLVALAALSKQRIVGLENVPTMAEAGLPEMMKVSSWEFWNGMQAPADTPRELIHAMNDALQQVNEDPAMRERFQKMSLRTLPRATPEEADRTVRQEIEEFRPLIKRVMDQR